MDVKLDGSKNLVDPAVFLIPWLGGFGAKTCGAARVFDIDDRLKR
jgi:hypothetical protein